VLAALVGDHHEVQRIAVSAVSAATASTGRLYVQMPMPRRGCSTGACGANQAARWIVVRSSVVTSNQYHPPSMNGPRSSSNSSVRSSPPSWVVPMMCIDSPSAFDR
jgi:hypothetical protein